MMLGQNTVQLFYITTQEDQKQESSGAIEK